MTRFDQSSPVQPVSDFRGGSTSVTDGGRRAEEQEILVTNIGFCTLFTLCTLSTPCTLCTQCRLCTFSVAQLVSPDPEAQILTVSCRQGMIEFRKGGKCTQLHGNTLHLTALY